MKKSIYELLKDRANENGAKVAFVDENTSITFRELLSQVEAYIAERKSGQGNESGRVIPVIAHRSVEAIVQILAIIISGDIYAPIPSEMPEDRVQQIMVSLITGQVPILEVGKKEDGSPIIDSPCMILQTSGTTSKPKGICISEANILHYLDSFGQSMDICGDEVFGGQAEFDYVAMIRDIFLPLRYGCTTAIIPKEYFMNPEKLYGFMEKHNVSNLCWSVSALTTVAKLGMLEDYDFSFVKKVIFTGSQIYGGILRKWQLALPEAELINHYGPAEVTCSCTYWKVDHAIKTFEKIPIGDTLPGYDIFLLPAPASEEKLYEICVAGPGLAVGYFDDPLQTQMKYEVRDDLGTDEPIRIYHTGDLGKVEGGNLVFCGRMDRQIKHMDYRVELDAIEFSALGMHGIVDVAVVNDVNRDKICMFYVVDESILSEEEKECLGDDVLVKYLKTKMPQYMVPRKVTRVDDIAKLSNGKTDYRKLEKLFEVEKKAIPKTL